MYYYDYNFWNTGVGAESKTEKERDRQRGQQDRHTERHTEDDLLVSSYTQWHLSSYKENQSQNKNPRSFFKGNHSSAVGRYTDALTKQEKKMPQVPLYV